ncbi:hypothetical protein FNH09_36935 [Streptomyces adustus]|uniref:Uncharacterized protein n=1 Tax=Streptomyces adustus TaxID=1609272 RepID=A0A5N8VMW8_9ACTN|nr:hypothetical protein [Streptomyces adustus]
MEASRDLLRGPEGVRGGGKYGTAVVLRGACANTRTGRAAPPVITVPARPPGITHRHRCTCTWTATLPATGYPLSRHTPHPTTAHAAEESPG